MKQKLCWKCRKDLFVSGNPNIDTIMRLLHCHHDLPEERPCPHKYGKTEYDEKWEKTIFECEDCGQMIAFENGPLVAKKDRIKLD